MQNNLSTETKTKNLPLIFLLLALTALLLTRLIPILKSPLSSYGYDYGFYFYAAGHPAQLGIGSILTALWGGYNNPLFNLTHLLRIPTVLVVNELYFFFAALAGWAMYYLGSRFSKTCGLLAAALFACSLVQSEAYTIYLWKNIAALPFLMLGFSFLLQKRWRAFAFSSGAILLLHRTTAIIYLLTIVIYFTYELIKARRYNILAFGWIAAIALGAVGFYILHLKEVILNLIQNKNAFVASGLFLENQNLLKIFWPTLLLGLPGIWLYIKNRENALLNIFFAVCGVWFLFHLPFYRRILVYLDLGLIFYAAYFLSNINYHSKKLKIALTVVLMFLIYRGAVFALNKQPLIAPAEAQELKNFRGGGFVLIPTANDVPWVLAYVQGSRLGAPGLLEDPHSYQEWMEFWSGQNQRHFLSYYPRPLYFYQRGYRIGGPAANCLEPLSQNFYRVDYDCLEKILQ